MNDNTEEDNDICVICLDDLEQQDNTSASRKLSCGHRFHDRCIQQWFDYYRSYCPICMAVVVNAPNINSIQDDASSSTIRFEASASGHMVVEIYQPFYGTFAARTRYNRRRNHGSSGSRFAEEAVLERTRWTPFYLYMVILVVFIFVLRWIERRTTPVYGP